MAFEQQIVEFLPVNSPNKKRLSRLRQPLFLLYVVIQPHGSTNLLLAVLLFFYRHLGSKEPI
jgi:hypothetical protein